MTIAELIIEVRKLRREFDGFVADARKRKLADRVTKLEKTVGGKKTPPGQAKKK